MSVLFCLLMLLCSSTCFALARSNDRASNLGGSGTEFLLAFPPVNHGWQQGNTYDCYLHIQSSATQPISVSWSDGTPIETKWTNDRGFVVFNFEARDVFYTLHRFDTQFRIYEDRSLVVKGDYPFELHATTRYTDNAGSFAVLPLSSLGRRYIVQSARERYDGDVSAIASVVGVEDNTNILFVLGGNDVTNTPGGLQRGDSLSFVLNRGDVFDIRTDGAEDDLTGSTFTGDKPFGLISSNMDASIPTESDQWDYIVEMQAPVEMYGNTYIVPSLPHRETSAYIKIAATQYNTTVWRDSNQIVQLGPAPGKEGSAFIHIKSDYDSNVSHIFSANKPIGISLYGPGREIDSTMSSPFQMEVIPTSRYVTQASVMIPTQGNIATQTYITIIHEVDANSSPLMVQFFEKEHPQWNTIEDSFSTIQQEEIRGTNTWRVLHIKTSKYFQFHLKSKSRFCAYVQGQKVDNGVGNATAFSTAWVNMEDNDFPSIEIVEELPRRTIVRAYDMGAGVATVTLDSSDSHMIRNRVFSPSQGELDFVIESQGSQTSAVPITIVDRCGNSVRRSVIVHGAPNSVTPGKERLFDCFLMAETQQMKVVSRDATPIDLTVVDLNGTLVDHHSFLCHGETIVPLRVRQTGIYIISVAGSMEYKHYKLLYIK